MNSLLRRCFTNVDRRWQSPRRRRRFRRSVVALGFIGTAAWISTAQTVETLDPIPEPITKGDLAVELIDFVQIPPSSSARPFARINLLFHAGDGSGRLFVNDTRGRIYIIRDGRLLPDPFLDLRAARGWAFRGGKKHVGLRTFAFHRDFAKTGAPGFGKFYTVSTETVGSAAENPRIRVFTTPTGSARHHDVIAEWTVDPADPDRIDPASRREILRIAQQFDDHNTGQLAFNPSAAPGDADYGMLYIAVGDGGNTYKRRSSVDADREGQNTRTPHGTILRINPLSRETRPYSVPSDNPFVGNPDVLPEIWAFGLRNPQRFSWDTGGQGKMLIADIGQDNVEEINIGIPGANYGWSEREGTFAVNHDDQHELFALPRGDEANGFIYPVAQYDHDEGDAIVGGFVYRGELAPDLYGKYIFGDLVRGRIFYVDVDDLVLGRQATINELTLLRNGVETTLLELLGDADRADLRFGMDEDGEIYILTKQDGMIRAWYQPF